MANYTTGMSSISGIISGLDIDSILTQMAQARSGPITNLQAQKAGEQLLLAQYQSLTGALTVLGSYADTLTEANTFAARSLANSDTSAVAAFASDGAALGTYELIITQLAAAHKIASTTVADAEAAMELSGDILVNGEAVTVASSDSLTDIRDAINAAGAGVTASIVTISETDHRLTITSNATGAENAIDLVDANSSDLLESLGLVGSATSIKTAITDGAASDYITDKATAVGEVLELGTSPSGTVQINGTDVAINLADDSLEDIAARITSTVANVTATVESEEIDGATYYRLEIVGSGGTPTFTDDNNVLVTLGVLKKDPANVLDQAQDAQFTIDGYSMARASNSVDDAIEGLSLELLAEDSENTITLTVSSDPDATVATVNNFITQYNSVVDLINQAQQYDSDTDTGGIFLGEMSVMLLEDGLRGAATNPVSTLGLDLQLLSQVGITTDDSDHLVLDATEFTDALASNPEAVKRLFGLHTDTTNQYVEYFSSTTATRDSGADGYVIEITQAATQASATSATLASGITQDENLTFYGGEFSAQLQNGMSLQEAVDHLNWTFNVYDASLTASVDGDTIVVEHNLYGSNYDIEISSTLDDGSGGTDLGGATAGVVETYTGQDVAGTINEEDATGLGRYLTGNNGNVNTAGLVLKITATETGSYGTVKVSKGMGSRLEDYISLVTDDDDGLISIATEGVSEDIEAIDEEIERLQEGLQRYIAGLQQDFLQMEQALARAQTLGDWMAVQIQTLTAMQTSQNS